MASPDMHARLDELAARAAAGQPAPLGATVRADGVNFSVLARSASRIELLLFADADDATPAAVCVLEAPRHRTADYWHVFVPGLVHGQIYAYRVHRDGPGCDAGACLLDPYARAVTRLARYERQAVRRGGDTAAVAPRAVVVDLSRYDWESDRPLPPPVGREVIYELHVGGFTRSPSCPIAPGLRGTFAGVVAQIPYLQALGVTAVELMPIQQFDPQDTPTGRPNFWGYSPLAWFAPHAAYGRGDDPTGVVDEFRDLVKALHRAGLRVIVDVVYNHTAEGDRTGPCLSWRGFAPEEYYIAGQDRTRLADFTGCGNTLNANHPVALRLVVDSLRHWVEAMHVDGFRFDLASALTRDELGSPLTRPPVLRILETEPALAGTTLIAEAWDAAGLYQVGSFPASRFASWNGPFRDDVRRFLRGDDGVIEALMARITGSRDVFAETTAQPAQTINFVTCHDGFTLEDLVTYNRKHNEANGEENRDGSDHNLSWNCGVEGPTRSATIGEVRRRQVRNHVALLLMSLGTPMLSMGDEVRRTQRGNNNAYCQDNPLGWFDWTLVEKHTGMLRFVRGLVAFTRGLRSLNEDRWWRATSPQEAGDISWHGVEVGKPDWRPTSHSLAYTLATADGAERVHVILNAWWKPLDFALPKLADGRRWHRVVDTSRPSPDDLTTGDDAPAVPDASHAVSWHTIIVLQAR